MSQGHPKFRALLEEIWEHKHCRKAEGYGDGQGDLLANLRASEALGIPAFIGAHMRGLDKDHRVNRAFRDLMETGRSAVPWPKTRSDLLERAAYCLLTIVLFEEEEPEDPAAPVPLFPPGREIGVLLGTALAGEA